MELVLAGLLGGWVLGMVVGWIGGRMTGIGEGRNRERRHQDDRAVRAEWEAMAARHPGVDPRLLAQDSMAEFAAAAGERGPAAPGAGGVA